jgi:hypothetical protein
MSDLELAVKTQKEFEEFLKYTLDANGDTFASLIISVKDRLSRSLVDDLRYIKNESNDLAHAKKHHLDSRQKFEEVSARVRESLLRVVAPSGSDIGHLIINKKSGKCLDVPWEMNSYIVHQWDCHRDINQQWILRKVEGNYVAIISRHTGRCLDVDHASVEDNAGVSQWKYHGGWNQQWVLTQLEDHSYQIRARHSEKVLDLVWGGRDDDATTTQYFWHGEDNQRWWIGAALPIDRA